MKAKNILKTNNNIICIFIIVSIFFCNYLINKVYATEISEKSDNLAKEEILEINKNNTNIIEEKIQKQRNNKVIIVGDSRMEYIEKEAEIVDIPINFSFIALGGSKIDWFEEKATQALTEKLNNADNKYNYHVIFNMGVNDMQNREDMNALADDYYKLYRNFAHKYQNINFYILSVNPVNEEKIYEKYKYRGRTDKKVNDYNETIKNMIYNDKLDNIYYCDSYNSIEFISPDGLHYEETTDQKIINFIVNDCINK